MKRCCKKAERELKETGFEILTTSVIYGWIINDLRTTSILNTALDLTKNTIKTDEKTQKNIGTFLFCNLL